MKNQGQVILGGLLILIGGLVLLGNLLNLNLWAFFWPVLFIGLGVWVIVRPNMLRERGIEGTFKLLGDTRRSGRFDLQDEEIFVLIGDVDLDLREATWPEGETLLRIMGFVADVDILLPEGAAVSLSSNAFVTDVRWANHKEEGFLSPVRLTSDGYEMARRRLKIEANFFVTDVDVDWE